jgi:SAM-dependent methyltransferase
MGSDDEWQTWGERDPYFGVLAHERFRRGQLTAAAREEFFASGREDLTAALAGCRTHLGECSLARTLDFGCGVGRVLIPLAQRSQQCVGVDVSEAMRAEAQRNCAAAGCTNVTLVRELGELAAAGGFTFIHSYIVLQHLEAQRGLRLIQGLLARLDAGGCAALHVTFARRKYAETFGTPPPLRRLLRQFARPLEQLARRLRGREPQMQMSAYDMNRVLFVAHEQGVRNAGLHFTDHAGNLGAMLFLRRE